MPAKDYKVRKLPGQKKWKIFDAHTGRVVGYSTKSKWHARVTAHIRDDWSQKYPKKKTEKRRKAKAAAKKTTAKKKTIRKKRKK